MKPFVFLTLLVCLVCSIPAETITKTSAAFSLPTTVGVAWQMSASGRDESFVSQIRHLGKQAIELLWSLPGKSEKGNISIFNLAGSRLKSFSVASREGSVLLNAVMGKKIAKGIYFAKLTSGSYKKSLRIIVN